MHTGLIKCAFNPDKEEGVLFKEIYLELADIFYLCGIFITLFERVNGAENFEFLILVALAYSMPCFLTQYRIVSFQWEIELLRCHGLFEWWCDALGLYVKIPIMTTLALHAAFIYCTYWNDVVYTMYYYGRLKASLTEMAIVIIIVTIGLGGILEMGEYTYDKYLSKGPLGQITGNTQMQGSPTQNAIDDTMNDLFTDTAGGIVGALLGVYFIRRRRKKVVTGRLR
jgi:hypothetical protein